jgi:hypothetical protein
MLNDGQSPETQRFSVLYTIVRTLQNLDSKLAFVFDKSTDQAFMEVN